MSAFIVVEVDVADKERYETYKQMVPPTLEAFGGQFLVRGGSVETLEGEWLPKRLVIVEFPSMAEARAWWASEQYAEAKALRQAKSTVKNFFT